MRWEIFKRDGLDCVPCSILGYCDPNGAGWCRNMQLPSPDLNPVTYRRLDALRSDNASLRMHLSHLRGKSNETWRDLVQSCACHNDEISTTVRQACIAYTEQFAATGTEAFERALDGRPDEKAALKETRRVANKGKYEHTKKRKAEKKTKPSAKPADASGKPPGVTSKDWAQRQRPSLNGRP